MIESDKSPTIEERREALVTAMREKGIPLTPRIERAFLAVPRHLFVPGVYLDAVYGDYVIVTRRDKDGVPLSESSRPSVMAAMLDALDIHSGQNVLEIGTGTGYNTALLAELVGQETGVVTSIEIDEETAEGAKAHLMRAGYPWVKVIVGDGAKGYPHNAPYDRIIATASIWDLPPKWKAQLKVNGVLVMPLNFAGVQIGAALRKYPNNTLRSVWLFPLDFIPLKGIAAGPERNIHVPGSALRVSVGDGIGIDEAQIHTLFSDDHMLGQLPAELERHNLGLFIYYLLFHQPQGFRFITYHVEEGQLAYGLAGYGWGIFSSTSACLMPYGDERVVNVYGGSDAYLTMTELAVAWQKAGRPGLERCHLSITPAGRTSFAPPEDSVVRAFTTKMYTYTLWMEQP